jgi:low affinity Fe/Cu permease
VQHPADRTEAASRGRFEQLAELGSSLAGSPLFFVVCLLVVLAWASTFAFGASDRVQTAASGLMTAITLLLVALLKNAELRAERAIQHKLDAIAKSLLLDSRGTPEHGEADLEKAIRLHEEI